MVAGEVRDWKQILILALKGIIYLLIAILLLYELVIGPLLRNFSYLITNPTYLGVLVIISLLLIFWTDIIFAIFKNRTWMKIARGIGVIIAVLTVINPAAQGALSSSPGLAGLYLRFMIPALILAATIILVYHFRLKK